MLQEICTSCQNMNEEKSRSRDLTQSGSFQPSAAYSHSLLQFCRGFTDESMNREMEPTDRGAEEEEEMR